ncbi:MAG: hypothetical protein R3A52_27180 [Polyangiales bacterium]
MRRATLRCAFALAALLVAPAASAQHNSPTAVLRYERGEGASACPDAQAVRDAVAARLGYDPFRESAPMTVRATITRHRRRLRGRVEVTDAAGAAVGTREIESSRRDCAEIASALTLAVSIVIDPLSLTRPAPAPAPPAPAPAPAPAPPPPPPPQPVVAAPAPPPPAPPPAPPRPPRSPSRRPALEVTLGGGLAFGHTPGLTGAVTASVGLRWSVVSLAIEGDHAFLSTAAREDGGAGEVQGSLSTGRLVPCLRQRLGARVDGAACGVVALGALGATAVGVDVSRPDTAFYAAVGLRLAARVALSPLLGLRVRADLLGALTPISLVIRDGTQELVVWSASPAALTAGIDLTATFP